MKEDFRSGIQTDITSLYVLIDTDYKWKRLNLKEYFRSGIQTDITSLYVLIDTDY